MPKTGTPAVEERRVERRAPRARTPTTARRTARSPSGCRGQHLGHRHRVRHDLGVDLGLADPAGDQLGVLGAEVDDEDQIVLRHGPSLSAVRPPARDRASARRSHGSRRRSARCSGAAPSPRRTAPRTPVISSAMPSGSRKLRWNDRPPSVIGEWSTPCSWRCRSHSCSSSSESTPKPRWSSPVARWVNRRPGRPAAARARS